MSKRATTLAAAGFVCGAVAGALMWSRVRHNYRGQLFSRHPLQRFVALSYLSARPTVESARVLRDYVRWEQRSVLRGHGARLLRRIEERLAEAA